MSNVITSKLNRLKQQILILLEDANCVLEAEGDEINLYDCKSNQYIYWTHIDRGFQEKGANQ